VCNNSPAESTSPENGWRLSAWPILSSHFNISNMNWLVGGRGGYDATLGASLSEIASSADLGGSSKYSNENFED
jgi:hypothetical protein